MPANAGSDPQQEQALEAVAGNIMFVAIFDHKIY